MHGALSKWETQNLDPRRIPDVEGMLALVKLGRRRIDRGIKWAKMLEYCRETRKQAEVVPVTALFLAPHGYASPQGDKIKQRRSLLGSAHGERQACSRTQEGYCQERVKRDCESAIVNERDPLHFEKQKNESWCDDFVTP